MHNPTVSSALSSVRRWTLAGWIRRNTWIAGALLVAALGPVAAPPSTSLQEARYQYAASPHPDGIGKVFLGREIAQVMGHQGAPWLERPGREGEERPAVVLELLSSIPTK